MRLMFLRRLAVLPKTDIYSVPRSMVNGWKPCFVSIAGAFDIRFCCFKILMGFVAVVRDEIASK